VYIFAHKLNTLNMLNTEKIQVPFMEDTYLTKVQSLRDPEKYIFTSADILTVSNHVNFTKARKDAGLIQGEDYIVLEKKSQSVELWSQLKDLGLIPERSARITLVYESGFWKIAMNARTAMGDKLRQWLATEVLPSIRKTGSYTMPSFVTPSLILENTKREVQLQNSKDVNSMNYVNGGVPEVINYNRENCLQVTGSTPSQIKKAYGRPSKSAKELLKQYDPAKAMTMSLNDHFVEKEGKELKELEQLDTLLIKTFEEMLRIGINIKCV
jgi:prophage antirepressor-like protein